MYSSDVRAFCTYFDHRYLTRGLALYESLQRHAGGADLHVLCMDELAAAALRELALPRLHVIPIAELERADPELAASRATRSTIEYYFTTSPSLPLYLLDQNPELESVTYVDADLFFF